MFHYSLLSLLHAQLTLLQGRTRQPLGVVLTFPARVLEGTVSPLSWVRGGGGEPRKISELYIFRVKNLCPSNADQDQCV